MKIESIQEFMERQEKVFGKKIANEILQEAMQGETVFIEDDYVVFKPNLRYLREGDEYDFDGVVAEYAKLTQDGNIQVWYSFVDKWREWTDENNFNSYDEAENAFQGMVKEFIEWEEETGLW